MGNVLSCLRVYICRRPRKQTERPLKAPTRDGSQPRTNVPLNSSETTHLDPVTSKDKQTQNIPVETSPSMGSAQHGVPADQMITDVVLPAEQTAHRLEESSDIPGNRIQLEGEIRSPPDESMNNWLRNTWHKVVKEAPPSPPDDPSSLRKVVDSKWQFAKPELISVAQAAGEVVKFSLKQVKTFGSGLPGVGAVEAVLDLWELAKKSVDNREEVGEVSNYLKDICNVSGGVLSIDKPEVNDISVLDNDAVLGINERLKELVEKLKTHRERNRDFVGHIRGFANAQPDEEELKAIWEGINRALALYQLRLIDRIHLAVLETNDILHLNHLDKTRTVLAGFDSLHTTSKKKRCLEGTRTYIREVIGDWVFGEGCEQIFWLHGMAGVGKSSISMSIAAWANELGILGGSFFFDNAVPELNRPACVFSTLARQLGDFDNNFKFKLCATLAEDEDIGSKGISEQCDKLFRGPLDDCDRKAPIVIVLDALDECEPSRDPNPEREGETINAVLSALCSAETRVRIFITSRPDRCIYNTISLSDGRVRDNDIEELDTQSDIRTFLHFRLGHLVGAVPEDEEEYLVSSCGTFFEYAATAIRFIQGRPGTPKERLTKLLAPGVSNAHAGLHSAYKNLNDLYLRVLSIDVAFPDYDKDALFHVKTVLATMATSQTPLSINELSSILDYTVLSIREFMDALCSVIIVPAIDSDKPRFFHASFADFITDDKRCTNKTFFVDVAAHHLFMAERCLEIMTTEFTDPKINITWGGIVSDSLRYACTYWPFHASRAKKDLNLEENFKRISRAEDRMMFQKWIFVVGLYTAEQTTSNTQFSLSIPAAEYLDYLLPGRQVNQQVKDLIVTSISNPENFPSMAWSHQKYICTTSQGNQVIVHKVCKSLIAVEDNEVDLMAVKEICVWAALDHVSVLSFQGAFFQYPFGFLWPVPHMKNGLLSDFMKKLPKGGESSRVMLAWLAYGLDHLHTKGIVYGDLNSVGPIV
ncbi:hypothetical protein SCHPADRAFT_180339 [Schizopora paradoxa]|uniref:Nephrocystin 3-like N-terminal domain-containing protein n=1 Tax=Schizopora paradoxa TaxID=27342 RepID=A0A0H2RZC4_9AGAM|nr:hypothetical protein SCHPADRAFT_180339 [Schizopora paradoxa]